VGASVVVGAGVVVVGAGVVVGASVVVVQGVVVGAGVVVDGASQHCWIEQPVVELHVIVDASGFPKRGSGQTKLAQLYGAVVGASVVVVQGVVVGAGVVGGIGASVGTGVVVGIMQHSATLHPVSR